MEWIGAMGFIFGLVAFSRVAKLEKRLNEAGVFKAQE